MLTANHIKEGLSAAYIHAVASRAGYSCSTRNHDYGIDGSINDIQIRSGRRRFETGFGIDFQAKASHNCNVSPHEVIYDLESKSHRDLVESCRGRPLILIVLVVPKRDSEWLGITPQQLELRRCAWWLHLRGQPQSANKRTVRVTVPAINIFDVASLQAMMDRVKRGGFP